MKRLCFFLTICLALSLGAAYGEEAVIYPQQEVSGSFGVGTNQYRFYAGQTGYYFFESLADQPIGFRLTGEDGQKIPVSHLRSNRYLIPGGQEVALEVSGERGQSYRFRMLAPQDGDVVYRPKEGNYIFFNNPEYITEADLLDRDLGFKRMMEAREVEGTNVFYAALVNRDMTLPFYFDVELYNPTEQAARVKVSRIGTQLADPAASGGYLKTGYTTACAWLDYFGQDVKGVGSGGFAESSYLDNPSQANPFFYTGYQHKSTPAPLLDFEVAPGKNTFVLERGELLEQIPPYFNEKMMALNYNVVFEFTVQGAPLTLSVVAYHDKAAKQTVRQAPLEDYIYKSREKFGSWEEKERFWSKYVANPRYLDKFYETIRSLREFALQPEQKNFAAGEIWDVIRSMSSKQELIKRGYQLFRHNEWQYLQFNGESGCAPEVEADIRFEIGDWDEGYLHPRVLNQYYPKEGIRANSWVTRFNPQRHPYQPNIIAESDLVGFRYRDNRREYVFDAFHTAFEPGAVKRGVFNEYREAVGSPNPENETCNLQNYGVLETNNITVANTGTRDRTISYYLSTSSNVLLFYDLKDGAGKQFKMKTSMAMGDGSEKNKALGYAPNTLSRVNHVKLDEKTQKVVEFTVKAGETRQVQLQNLLTNADVGAFEHILILEDRP